MDRSRWGALFFRTGSVVLLLLGLAHGFGHYMGKSQPPADERERRVMAAMYGETFDVGGSKRSVGEIHDGLSLYSSIGPMAAGLLALYVSTRRRRDPSLLRGVAMLQCLWLVAMLGVSLRYWFIAPTSFFVLALACFGVAWRVLPRDDY